MAVLRTQPELAGPVASDPLISQLISELAADAPRVLRETRKARAAARERDWALAGRAPGADGDLYPRRVARLPLPVDGLDPGRVAGSAAPDAQRPGSAAAGLRDAVT